MSELDELLKRKAGELTARKVDSPILPEKQLILSWKDDRGFAISFNLTWCLQNASDLKNIFAIMNECSKELQRRGINRQA